MTRSPLHGFAALLASSAIAAMLLAGCAPSAVPVPSETPAATPSEPAEPTPTPAATRPLNVTGISCEELVPIELLESAAGVELVAGGAMWTEFDDASVRTWFEFAGGFRCTWSDAESGKVRAMGSMVPSGGAAEVQVSEEFAAAHGGSAITQPRPLSSGCLYDYCTVSGSIDDDFVYLGVFGLPWSDEDPAVPAEIQALQDAVAAQLATLPPAGPIPALSERWSDGPDTCEELLSAGELAEALGVSSVRYTLGYPYEESMGNEIALLTAGGFTCRVAVDDEPQSGTVVVLPDAAGAYLAAADLPGRAFAPATGITTSCVRNGDDSEASSTCRAAVAAGDAWLSITDGGYGDEEIIAERVDRMLAAFSEALERS